ncbi:esterase FE4 isoform X2 [Aethina tumida]|uniref:esterase FE4 isoform X2 n=1 Tax=Aethina tumida TaxID=116153 RepID=UPI002148EA1C|nr:esterase FE4 isoform X2 [Aethina tumida]
MKYSAVILLCLSTVSSFHQNDDHPTVSTPMGKIRGSVKTTRLGKTIYSFRGIRYAEAPINKLRFQPPKPVEKYYGVYDATEDGPMCPQDGFGGPYSEDCLLLNVYTTKVQNDSIVKRPVIIFFHAGGWYSGTGRSNWYGPDYFMDQNIVLVTLNYRLSALGFLSTGDKHAPGNNGLKDQVVAMKWVQKNIESFGGDKDAVTIMGYSAGGWSVTLHMVSPMSKGLFHKAVASSGSFIGNWPIPKHQMGLAKRQANVLGCPDSSSEIIMDCLKNKTGQEIGTSSDQLFDFLGNPILLWSAVIEEDFGQERFLPDHPVNLVKSDQLSDVPFITGVTKDEFAGSALYITEKDTLLEILDKHWNEYAPICFIYEGDTKKGQKFTKAVREFYLQDKPLTNDSLIGLAQLFADGVIGYSVKRIEKFYSTYKTQPTYAYKFSYPGRFSHVYLPGTEIPYGVVHHDDLIYLFYISELFPYFNSSYPESKMVETLTGIYASFASTGQPNCSWDKFEVSSQKYLDIGKTLEVKEKLYIDRYNLWERYFPTNEI